MNYQDQNKIDSWNKELEELEMRKNALLFMREEEYKLPAIPDDGLDIGNAYFECNWRGGWKNVKENYELLDMDEIFVIDDNFILSFDDMKKVHKYLGSVIEFLETKGE